MALQLSLISGEYMVCRLAADAPLPDWAWAGTFCSVTRTPEELSIVTRATATAERSEASWACLKLEGPFDFALTGILSSVLEPLRDAGVGIFAISTFDTDYVLMKATQLEAGIKALTAKGHHVRR